MSLFHNIPSVFGAFSQAVKLDNAIIDLVTNPPILLFMLTLLINILIHNT